MLSSLKREQQRTKKLIDGFKQGVRTQTRRVGIDLTDATTQDLVGLPKDKNNNQVIKVDKVKEERGKIQNNLRHQIIEKPGSINQYISINDIQKQEKNLFKSPIAKERANQKITSTSQDPKLNHENFNKVVKNMNRVNNMYKSPINSKTKSNQIITVQDAKVFKRIEKGKTLGISRSTHKLEIDRPIFTSYLNQANNGSNIGANIGSNRNIHLKAARRNKINLADSCSSRNSNISSNSAERIDRIFGNSLKKNTIASRIIESSLSKFKDRKYDAKVKTTSYEEEKFNSECYNNNENIQDDKDSEKKLTVPVEPNLNTNKRASDINSRQRNNSSCNDSETSLKRSIPKRSLFSSTINPSPQKILMKCPSLPNYQSQISAALLIPRQPSIKCVSPNHKSSMVEYKTNIPPDKDGAFYIKEKIKRAEERKTVYEMTKKGFDNDNFLNHMQTLRKNSRSGKETTEERTNSKLRSSMIELTQSDKIAKLARTMKPTLLNRVYSYGPASPSSNNIQHETSSSIDSVNEMYENYKKEMVMSTKNRSISNLIGGASKRQRRGRDQRNTFIHNQLSITEDESNLIQSLEEKVKFTQKEQKYKIIPKRLENKKCSNNFSYNAKVEEPHFTKDSASPSSTMNIDSVGNNEVAPEIKLSYDNPIHNKRWSEFSNIEQIKEAKIEETEAAINTSDVFEISNNTSFNNIKESNEVSLSIDESMYISQNSAFKSNANEISSTSKFKPEHKADVNRTDTVSSIISSNYEMELFKIGFHQMDILMESSLDLSDKRND